MKIIVDAYNILKQLSTGMYVDEQERRAFLVKIAAYARAKSHTILVVFDGGDSLRSTFEKIGKVTVVYAGRNRQADTFIKEYVAEHKEYDFLLVTSDRELQKWVARYNVPSLDSQEFYKQMNKSQEFVSVQQFDQKPVKLGTSLLEVDILMEEAFDHGMLKDENEQDKDRSSPACRPSKKERAYLKKIKKL